MRAWIWQLPLREGEAMLVRASIGQLPIRLGEATYWRKSPTKGTTTRGVHDGIGRALGSVPMLLRFVLVLVMRFRLEICNEQGSQCK